MSDIKFIRCRRSNQTFYIHIPSSSPVSSIQDHIKELLSQPNDALLRLIKIQDVDHVREYVESTKEGSQESLPEPALEVVYAESNVNDLENNQLLYVQFADGPPEEEDGEPQWESLENVIEPAEEEA
mmetsp:Transcript_3593/g.13738  ORF Transcript_3593/g.13738 Transcript_3593/m.13738 type:complete len:127 (+) Transcript_3593:24-404(+)